MPSILNSSIQSINYVSRGGDQAILSVSGSGAGGAMLVDSVAVQAQRGANIRYFLNGANALFLGKGQGQATITGLFGTKEQMSALLGTPSNPCDMSRTISLSAGVLQQCEGGQTSSGVNASITLHGCVVQSFSVQTTIDQGGSVFQQATVNLLLSDVSID
jgi:hypothetical protein